MIPTISCRNGEVSIDECPLKPETCEFTEEGAHNVKYCVYASRETAIRCPNYVEDIDPSKVKVR